MSSSREEETRRARELHLLRDERDREVEEAGGEKAGRVLLWTSQMLAALCVFQGDPAWAALLSLTFVSAAARSFHRFASDREGAPLLLGLAASAAALGLWVWFYLDTRPEWLTLGRLVEVIILFQALSALAALAFLGLTLGAFWVKFKVCHMDGDKWSAYFEGMPTTDLLGRMGMLLALALCLAAALGYFLFLWRGFPAPGRLTAVFLVIGALRLPGKMGERREELVTKLLRFKSASFSREAKEGAGGAEREKEDPEI